MFATLFKKKKTSNIVNAGGPSAQEQLLSMSEDRYWTVLNSSLLKKVDSDLNLSHRANALKNALQTFGPTSHKLPDCRENKGNAKGSIFHGHAINSTGTHYVLEWTVIDSDKRILALVGFGTHENYSFKQKPLSKNEISVIINSVESQKIIHNVAQKIIEAKDKVERIEQNYRKCSFS